MSPGVKLTASRNRVKTAGKRLRDHELGAKPLAAGAFQAEIDILDHWRACHSYPLQKATMGLRTRANTADCKVMRIGQRLKRRPTIVDKAGARTQDAAHNDA